MFALLQKCFSYLFHLLFDIFIEKQECLLFLFIILQQIFTRFTFVLIIPQVSVSIFWMYVSVCVHDSDAI